MMISLLQTAVRRLDRLWFKLTTRRFLGVFVAPHVLFIALAAVTESSTLIAVLNMMVMSLSVGVVFAYLPSALAFVFEEREADNADFLTVGITSGFWAIVVITAYTAIYRWYGMPSSMQSTDVISYARFFMAYAAVCHLVAPGALKQSIPPKRWLMIGVTASLGIFAALVILYYANVLSIVQLIIGPHDLFDAPTMGGAWHR